MLTVTCAETVATKRAAVRREEKYFIARTARPTRDNKGEGLSGAKLVGGEKQQR